jgi:enoyl-CoA hydratase
MSTNYLNVQEVENGFKVISVTRPEALNALNSDVLNELNRLFETYLSEETKVNGIILTGDGEKSFIAGADIKSMIGMSSDEARALSQLGQQTTLLMESLPFPVIACVNGFALGGGMEMALGADFIYASENAVFGLPEVKLGLIPGFGGTQRLSKLVGKNKAREIIYTGKNITALEAKSLGIVNEVYANKTELIETGLKTLKTIGKNSMQAVSQAKKALLEGSDHEISEGLRVEADIFSGVFELEDAKEGTIAFSEKRKPNFKHF